MMRVARPAGALAESGRLAEDFSITDIASGGRVRTYEWSGIDAEELASNARRMLQRQAS